MGLVDVNSPLSFFIVDTNSAKIEWRNNHGDVIFEDRKTGECSIRVQTSTPNKFEIKYAKTFDKAIDCLKYIKYKEKEQNDD